MSCTTALLNLVAALFAFVIWFPSFKDAEKRGDASSKKETTPLRPTPQEEHCPANQPVSCVERCRTMAGRRPVKSYHTADGIL